MKTGRDIKISGEAANRMASDIVSRLPDDDEDARMILMLAQRILTVKSVDQGQTLRSDQSQYSGKS